jgi:hypothetical protein
VFTRDRSEVRRDVHDLWVYGLVETGEEVLARQEGALHNLSAGDDQGTDGLTMAMMWKLAENIEVVCSCQA